MQDHKDQYTRQVEEGVEEEPPRSSRSGFYGEPQGCIAEPQSQAQAIQEDPVGTLATEGKGKRNWDQGQRVEDGSPSIQPRALYCCHAIPGPPIIMPQAVT